MLPEFLFYCFMRQYAEIRSFGRGGQQLNLNKELVKAIEVPCPLQDVQAELVEHIQSTLRIADENEAQIKLLETLADNTRTALLRDAFGGRLTVQDPDDEPAAVTLERVRAQQTLAPSRGRRGLRAAMPV
jgi:type I restriction enzyme S subunit